jgi:hypothetical protein
MQLYKRQTVQVLIKYHILRSPCQLSFETEILF